MNFIAYRSLTRSWCILNNGLQFSTCFAKIKCSQIIKLKTMKISLCLQILSWQSPMSLGGCFNENIQKFNGKI